MLSTSKSNQLKAKSKFDPKSEQQWQMEQQKRNWLELPYDVMANILYRVGVFDILENAQKVCTAWYKICKEPAMWRVIYMENHLKPSANARPPLREMCKHAVDRSQGQLVDLTIKDFADLELLLYVADRSSQLRRLNLISCYDVFYDGCAKVMKKFPLLEELSLYRTDIRDSDIESVGHCCPKLTTLKVNKEPYKLEDDDGDEVCLMFRNMIAVAIGKSLPELRHLELIDNSLTNTGLQAILDGCLHLQTLDLRQCVYLDLKGEFGKKCSEKIKSLKLPNDPYDGCPIVVRGGPPC